MTGDADSAQVVLAVQVYVDNNLLLIKALNDLFNLFRYANVNNHRHALEVRVVCPGFFFTKGVLSRFFLLRSWYSVKTHKVQFNLMFESSLYRKF